MKFGAIRVGTLAGIPILLSPSWFILFGLTTWLLATQFYPDALEDASRTTHYAMAACSVILFFVSIVLHELAHSLVARAYRIPVKSITLFILGGAAQITREAAKPWHEFLMAAAGPLTSFALCGSAEPHHVEIHGCDCGSIKRCFQCVLRLSRRGGSRMVRCVRSNS